MSLKYASLNGCKASKGAEPGYWLKETLSSLTADGCCSKGGPPSSGGSDTIVPRHGNV